MQKNIRSICLLTISLLVSLSSLTSSIILAADTAHLDYKTEGRHENYFKNTSTDSRAYYVVDKFQITITNNDSSTVNTTTLQCSGLNGLDCSGGTGSGYGGTKSSTIQSGSNYTLQWQYGTPGNSQPYDGRPLLAPGQSLTEAIEYFVKTSTPENTPVRTSAQALVAQVKYENNKYEIIDCANNQQWCWKDLKDLTIYYHRPTPQITKTSDTARIVKPGQEIVYDLTIKNTSSYSTLESPSGDRITITDALDSDLDLNTIRTITNSSASRNLSGSNLIWTFSTPLEPNQSKTVSFGIKVKTTAKDGAIIENHGVLTSEEPTKQTPDTEHEVNVDQFPDLNISKSANPPSGSNIPTGSTITYILNYQNTGQATATNVFLEDTVQSNTFSSISAPGATQTGSTYRWNIGTLAPGQSGSKTFTATTLSTLNNGFVIKNHGSIDSDQTQKENSNETTHTISTPKPVTLTISKSANPVTGSQVQAGDTIEYILDYANTGDVAAHNVTITDVLSDTWFSKIDAPSATETGDNYSWYFAKIDAHTSKQIKFKATTKSNLATGTLIKNSATIDSDETNLTRSNETVHSIIGLPPSVTISKSADPATGSLIPAGSSIKYKLKFQNTGPTTLHNVIIVDVLSDQYFSSISAPGSTETGDNYSWYFPTLPPSGISELNFTATTKANLPNGTTIFNSATIDTDETTPKESNQTVHTIKGGQPAVVTISKSANPISGSTINAGSSINYSLTFTNTGGQTLHNVIVVDVLPDNWFSSISAPGSTETGDNYSWYFAILNIGESKTVNFTATTKGNLTAGTVIINSATIDTDETLIVKSNETRHTIATQPVPDVTISKSADPVSGSTIPAGSNIKYSLTFKNTGVVTLNNIVITDVLSSSYFSNINAPGSTHTGDSYQWKFSQLTPNQSTIINFTATTKSTLAGGTVILNSATIDTDETDLKHSNETRHTISVQPNSDVSIIKSANPVSGSIIDAGSDIKYTLSFKNTGNQTLHNVTVTDVLSDSLFSKIYAPEATETGDNYSWYYPLLAVGETQSVTFTATTKANLADGTVILNSATIETDETLIVRSNETSHIIKRPQTPQLTISKSANPISDSNIFAGDVIIYTLQYKNIGPVLAHNVIIGDVFLPTRFSKIESVPAFTKTGNRYEWNVGTLNANQAGQIVITATTSSTLSAGVAVLNEADIDSDETNLVKSNKTVHYIINKPGLSIQKLSLPESGATIPAGSMIMYTVTIQNNYSKNLTNISLEDIIDDSAFALPPISISSQGSFDAVSQKITWPIGTLQAGASRTVLFSINTKSDIDRPTDVDNFATVKSSLGNVDSNLVIHHLTPPPRISVSTTKSADPISGSTIQAGTLLVYKINFQNTGTTNLSNFSITDILSADRFDLETLNPGEARIFGTDPTTPIATVSGSFNESNRTLSWNFASTNHKNLNVTESGYAFFSVKTLSSLADKTAIINKGTVHSVEIPNQDTNEVIHHIAVPEHLAEISKDADPVPLSSILAGSQIKYILKYKNTATETLHAVQITDELPDSMFDLSTITTQNNGIITGHKITWSLGDLAGQASGEVTFTVKTLSSLTPGENKVANEFKLAARELNLTSNKVFHHIISEPGRPDLSIAKSAIPASGSTIKPGDSIAYTIHYQNTGNVNLTDVLITDVLSSNLDSATSQIIIGQSGTYNESTKTISWVIGSTLAPGVSGDTTFTAKAKTDLADGTTILNSAVIDTNELEPKRSNETIHTIKRDVTQPASCTLTISPKSVNVNNLPMLFTASVTISNGTSPQVGNMRFEKIQGTGSLSPTTGSFTSTYSSGSPNDVIRATYQDTVNNFSCSDQSTITTDGGGCPGCGDGGGSCTLTSQLDPYNIEITSDRLSNQFAGFLTSADRTNANPNDDYILTSNQYTWQTTIENPTFYTGGMGGPEVDPTGSPPANPIFIDGYITTIGQARIVSLVDNYWEDRKGGVCRANAFIKRTSGGGDGSSCIDPALVVDARYYDASTNTYGFNLRSHDSLANQTYTWKSSDPDGQFSLPNEENWQTTLTTTGSHAIRFRPGINSKLPIQVRVEDPLHKTSCSDTYTIQTSSCQEIKVEKIATNESHITEFKAWTPNWENQLEWILDPIEAGHIYDANAENPQGLDYLITPGASTEENAANVFFVQGNGEWETIKGILTIQSLDPDPACRVIIDLGEEVGKRETLEKFVSPTTQAVPGQELDYTIKYHMLSSTLENKGITLVDTIGIQGYIPEVENRSGKIVPLAGTLKIVVVTNGQENILPVCQPGQTVGACLDPNNQNFFSAQGITVKNLKKGQAIKITYKTKVDVIESEVERYCMLDYTNTVTRYIGGEPELAAKANVWVLPPYLLTRNGGDVLMQEAMTAGSDVSCMDANNRNTTGLAVKPTVATAPGEQEPPRTGLPAWVYYTDSLCDDSLGNPNSKDYNPLDRFSSFVCELKVVVDNVSVNVNGVIKVAEAIWGQANIEQGVTVNQNYVLKAHTESIDGQTLKNLTELSNLTYTQPNPAQRLYRFTGGLTIDTPGQISNFRINTPTDPNQPGAMTFIIETGDLIINENITYDDGSALNTNQKQIPSIAFIVLNGKIKVAATVTRLDGIYYTNQSFESLNNEINDHDQLIINGSVYGDIQPLFQKRTFTGDPKYDKGAIIINYDERILFSTPPGLQQFVNLRWEEVAR